MTTTAVPLRIRTTRRLTDFQRSLWASQLRHRGSAMYNMAVLSQIDGAVDAQRLADAFEAVVNTTDILRTRLSPADEGGVDLWPTAPRPSEILYLDRGELLTWAEQRTAEPLDMTQCGYDSVILRHGDGGTSWYLNLHHIVTDAQSSKDVFDATARVYHDAASVDMLAPFYDPGRGAELAPTDNRAAEYWRTRSNAPRLSRLYQPIEHRTTEGARTVVPLTPKESADLVEALAGDYRMPTENLGWSALLLTATALLAHRLSGESDFSIGFPVRDSGAVPGDGVLGPRLTLLPVDVHIDPADTHSDLHRRIRRALLQTLKRSRTAVRPAADFDIVVNIIPDVSPSHFGDLDVQSWWLHPGETDPEHALRVQLVGFHGGEVDDEAAPVAPRVLLDTRSASTPDGDAAARHFAAVLRAIVGNADQHIAAVPLITTSEQNRLSAWETGPGAVPAQLLGDRLAEALAASERETIRDDNRALTGRELWQQVLDAAAGLQNSGLQRGDRVAIVLRPSIEALITIFATMVAGGSFVPIDPEQPESKRLELLAMAAATHVFDTEAAVHALVGQANVSSDHRFDPITPADEAYVLFTSGSTGQAKAVPITHGGIAGYIDFALNSYFGSTSEPPIAPLFGSLGFDLTMTTIFAPLLAHGRLIAITPPGAAAIAEIARHTELTWCKATPSHLEVLLPLLDQSSHGLRTVVVGGEAFTRQLAQRLQSSLPGLVLFNEYGPTEAVVGCMIHEYDEHKASHDVPIGRPAPGVTLRVVDAYGQRLPPGAAGELWISHNGMMAGYLNTGTDAETSSPFGEADGLRFYRSGDLVRLNNDGDLVYVGRVDEQIKLGGVRIDPSEIEAALERHPLVERALVRMWSPKHLPAVQHCVRCGLPDNVPGVAFDAGGLCDTCVSYDRVAPVVDSWFKEPADLVARVKSGGSSDSGFDCVHLLSGGKDSTYALYRLVELGLRPYVLTLDNGFISETAKDNARRVSAALNLPHEFLTTPAMNEILADSLATHSNVCNGCYKTIYTLATTRAVELGITTIVTGLSRGQLFETRLLPQQFSLDRFDPAAIDRSVLQARKLYHRIDDFTNRALDTSVFDSDDLFDVVDYVDFYRYVDVELEEMLTHLTERTPWRRPADTGRSSNCLINAAGIHTHLSEQGYHNYAVPYAWDVRLGHKTRDEAIAELDDQLDLDDVAQLLNDVGYTIRVRSILTAWLQIDARADRTPTATELRSFLATELAARSIPSAFVEMDQLPITTGGKVDISALPTPTRTHRSASTIPVAAETEIERAIVTAYERTLGLEPISLTDDFFALGGDSLAALQMVLAVSDGLQVQVPSELAFTNTTPRDLADAIESVDRLGVFEAADAPTLTSSNETPAVTQSQQELLLHQRLVGTDPLYNISRVFVVDGPVAAAEFKAALLASVATEQSLRWGFGPRRQLVAPQQALQFAVATTETSPDTLDDLVRALQLPTFDLEGGPLLRCSVQPLSDGTTAVVFIAHHAYADHDSFGHLWSQVDDRIAGRDISPPSTDFAAFNRWQIEATAADDKTFWRSELGSDDPVKLDLAPVVTPTEDRYLTRPIESSPARLKATAARTPIATAVAGVVAALAPLSSDGRVDLSLVASTRTHPSAQKLFGYMLNPLPVRVDCSDHLTLNELTGDISRRIGRALPHRGYPASAIIDDRRQAGLAVAPAEVLVAYNESHRSSLLGVPVWPHTVFNGHAVAPMTFFLDVREDRVEVGLEYQGRHLNADTADALLNRFAEAVDLIVSSPASRISSIGSGAPISVLDGGPAVTSPLVLDQIRDNFTTRATSPAVMCGTTELSYQELDAKISAVMETLRGHRVNPGDRVVVVMERSAELIAALLAVQLLGASYVPIDLETPPARRRQQAAAAGAAVALVSTGHDVVTPNDIVVTGTDLDGRPWTSYDGAAAPSDPSFMLPTATDEAYIISTSGSTGTPRGVPISHRQLANSTNARRAVYGSDPAGFLMVSSAAFDSSIVGIFWTLATGGTLVLPTDQQAHDIDALISLMSVEPVSHVLCVPTLYRAILDRAATVAATSAHWPTQVIVAGEACPTELVAAHYRGHARSRLTNEYGPTEAAVWATAYHCVPGPDSVPIGSPPPGVWVAIIDRNDNPCPHGVVGELVIGGAQVGLGYLSNAAESAAKFGHDATVIGSALTGNFFRTGDRASIINGQVYFHGRDDDQLNLGGRRIDPLEVEEVLVRAPNVLAAVVTSSTVSGTATGAGADGSKRLAAHMETSGPVTLAELQQSLNELAPGLRPTVFVVHNELPRTTTGKLDRRASAVSVIDDSSVIVRSVAATGGAPNAKLDDMTKLFRTVLQSPGYQPHDSFFDHGGHSLLAVELVIAIENQMGIELATSAVYQAPTAEAMAAHVATLTPTLPADRANSGRAPSRNLVIPIQPEGTQPPLFALHVLGRNGQNFAPLARRLGQDQPVWGIGPQVAMPGYALDAVDLDADASISATCARYVAEIEAVAPSGPLRLIGECRGSLMAQEVARQFVERGRDVDHVIMIDDWHAPDIDWKQRLSVQGKIRWRTELLVRHRGDFSPQLVYTILRNQLTRSRTKMTRLVDVGLTRVANRLKLPLPKRLQKRAHVEQANMQVSEYVFTPYSGQVSIFRGGRHRRWVENINGTGWGDLIPNATVTQLPVALLLPEIEVDVFADALIRTLSDTSQQHSASIEEATIIDALAAGRVSQLLHNAKRHSPSTGKNATILARLDETTRAIGTQVRQSTAAVVDELNDVGLAVSAAPTPAIMTSHVGIIDTDSARPDVVSAMHDMGYLLLNENDVERTDLALNFHGTTSSHRVVVRSSTSRAAATGDVVEALSSSLGHDQRLGGFLATPRSIVGPILDETQIKPGDTVVDVGCGSGSVLIAAAKQGYRGVGIEIDAELADLARANVAAAGLEAQIDIITGDAFANAHVLLTAAVVFAFIPPDRASELVEWFLEQPTSATLVMHELLKTKWGTPPDRSTIVFSTDDDTEDGAAVTVAHLWSSRATTTPT